MSDDQDMCGPVGELARHTTDDDDTVGWEFNLGNNRHVWCGQLSKVSFGEMPPEHRDAMATDLGWFIVLYEPHDERVLGKAVDEDAARELTELIGRALMDNWHPIDTLPGSDAPLDLSGAVARGEREPLVLAKTADGRRMIWRPSILRAAMKEGTPAHLGFPAIAWMPLPE